MKRIYLDNNASTPIDDRLFKLIVETQKQYFGNPSSVHSYGQEVRNQITKARRKIASYLSVHPKELVFTSGGTESINMVLRGCFVKETPFHIITSTVEHSSIYYTIKYLESLGATISYLQPGIKGRVEQSQVIDAIREDTRLVVLMSVNNETGVKTDIETIASYLLGHQIPFVVDGVAQLGKEIFSIPEGVSAMCFSGHKIHAPKGIGLTFIRSGFKLESLILGGPQEASRRGGTENVVGIVAFAEAISYLENDQHIAIDKMRTLRDRLENQLMNALPDVSVNGDKHFRICNTSNLSFKGVDGESLMMNLDLRGIATSHGSACASGSLEPSRILLNMGLSVEEARSSIRFSISRMNTEEEIDIASQIIIEEVQKLRTL